MLDPAILGDDEKALQKPYTFWVFVKSRADDWKPKPIANFSTASEFWGVYQHLKRPSQLETGTMINLVSPTFFANQFFAIVHQRCRTSLGRREKCQRRQMANQIQ